MNTIVKRNPDLFGGLMDSFFNDSNWFIPEMKERFSMPAVNIRENDVNYEVAVAAPGLNKEDFNIQIEENVLKLSVDKTTESEENKENFTRKEFSYMSFERSFSLPKNTIDTEKIEASYIDGILKINLPKLNEAIETVKKITVV